MTWPPEPQPACTEPCCTGGTLHTPKPEPAPRQGTLRECGVAGCIHCRVVTAPGGGDRLPFSTTKGPTDGNQH